MWETEKQLSLQCCNYLKPIYQNSNFQTLRGHYGRSMRHYINSTNEVLIRNSTRENSIWTSHGTDNVCRQMTDFCSIMLTSLVQKQSICSSSPSVFRIYKRKSNSKGTDNLQLLFLMVDWLNISFFCEEEAMGAIISIDYRPTTLPRGL